MTRLEKIPARAWVALALVLRLAFALKAGNRLFQIDEIGFHSFAWGLARTGTLAQNGQPIVAPPVPCGFFALFFALFGDHALAPRLAQAAVAAATAWMIGRMAGDLTGSPRAGRLALAVAAVYPFFVYYAAILMSETLYVALVVPALWMTGRAIKNGGAGDAALAGLSWSLAALTRIEAAPIAALVWIIVFARIPRRAWLAGVIVWASPLLLWSARNKAAAGSFSLDNHGGITLLHGTLLHDVAEAEDTSVAVAQLEKEKWYQDAQGLPDAEKQALYARKAVDFMKDDPLRTLRQWAQKLVAFWRFYPRVDKVYRASTGGSPDAGAKRWVLVAISLLFEPWLIILGFIGLWRLRRKPEIWPMWIFIAASTGVHVLIVSMMRYRLAVMPLMMLGACFVLASVGEPVAQDR